MVPPGPGKGDGPDHFLLGFLLPIIRFFESGALLSEGEKHHYAYVYSMVHGRGRRSEPAIHRRFLTWNQIRLDYLSGEPRRGDALLELYDILRVRAGST